MMSIGPFVLAAALTFATGSDLAFGRDVFASGPAEHSYKAAVVSVFVAGNQVSSFRGDTPNFNLEEPRIDVAQFGAVAGTDISAAITKAVAYLDARGGGVLDFAGIDAYAENVIISGASNIHLIGSGAKIRRPAGSTSTRAIFNIKNGCENVSVTDFALIDGGFAGATRASTGERPVILIGDDAGLGGLGLTNSNIRISRNIITGGNWAAVMVYGRSNNARTMTPANRGIFVHDNRISDSSNGIFFYKNGHDLHVYGNVIEDVGYDGIIFDTRSQSDTVGSEALSDIHCYNNTISRFGRYGYGVGILYKGLITDAHDTGNTVEDGLVNSAGSFTNTGILVTQDYGRSAPDGVTVSNATIRRIASSKARGGYELLVNAETENFTLDGLEVSDTTNHGLQIGAGAKNAVVRQVRAVNCGEGIYSIRAEGTTQKPIINLIMDDIVVERGGGTSSGGVYIRHVSNGRVLARADDFTRTAIVVLDTAHVIVRRLYGQIDRN